MSSLTVFLLVLLGLQSAALGVVYALYRKEKKKKVRRVEAPNSQFKSPYVQDLESRDTWESMDLGHLHEVNREEVEKLLGKVKAVGVKGLTPAEREFLDRMAEAAGRRKIGRVRNGGGSPPRRIPHTS